LNKNFIIISYFVVWVSKLKSRYTTNLAQSAKQQFIIFGRAFNAICKEIYFICVLSSFDLLLI